MIITKKESKNLRYFARANYKSECKGVETENGKIKHREFPCFELAYDESKATAGNVELTNVTIGGKPFDGGYTALMTRLRELLDNPDDVCAEELEQDKTLTEQAVDAVKDKSDTIVIAEKPGDIIKEIIKDTVPEDSEISMDVTPEESKVGVAVYVPNVVNQGITPIESIPVEEIPTDVSGVSDLQAKLPEMAKFEVVPSTMSVIAEEPLDNTQGNDPSARKDIVNDEQPASEQHVVSDAEETTPAVEETGTPVITAEQHKDTIHLDAAAEGTNDVTMVVEAPKPKKLTRAELYDLQMRCGVMRLATLYGDDPDTKLDVLMKLYPDAATRLNEVFAADGIKTYTITEEAIKRAYPDEYAALRT